VAIEATPKVLKTTTIDSLDMSRSSRPQYPLGLPSFANIQAPPTVGGRLQKFVGNWRMITTDQWVLGTLERGLKWTFSQRPRLSYGKHWLAAPRARAQLEPITQKVQDLLNQNAIEEVTDPESPGYYSRFFVVPKKAKGEWRPILDLSTLNTHIQCPTFKMDTAEKVRQASTRGQWATSLDLVDAYLHMPIAPTFRKYLRFVVGDKVYQYRVLPAGLNLAPWAWSRLIAAVREYAHRNNLRLFQYIDDWLLLAASSRQCRQATQWLLRLAESLGFLVHQVKSQLEPAQEFTFLGYRFNLKLGVVNPPEERWTKVSKFLREFLKRSARPAVVWQQVLGHLVALEKMVPLGMTHLRTIQHELRRHWCQRTGDPRDIVPITPISEHTLRWWLVKANVMSGVPLHRPKADREVFTDASLHGWGGHLEGATVQGKWSPGEALQHINWLELEAVHRTLSGFVPQLSNRNVLVATDNTTVVAYINSQGGTHSLRLCLKAQSVHLWAQGHGMTIRARHIPGRLNVVADLLSRSHQTLSTEWSLDQQVFKGLCQVWGTPTIDLFATRYNAKLKTFISPMPDPLAHQVDALSQSWSGLWAYAYPPQATLTEVLNKVRSEDVELLLVAPNWPRAGWFPMLVELLVDNPRRLPLREDLLRQPMTDEVHNSLDRLALHGWRLSRRSSARQAFLRTLPLVSQHPNALLPSPSTNQNGQSSVIGVINGRLVHSKPLLL